MNDHDILLELLEAKNRFERQRKIERIVAVVLILALAAALFFAWARISATRESTAATIRSSRCWRSMRPMATARRWRTSSRG